MQRSCYIAIERHKAEGSKNKYCNLLLKSGLFPVVILKKKVPSDMCVWMQSEFNDYHRGLGFCIPEMLEETPRAVFKWKAHRAGKAPGHDSTTKSAALDEAEMEEEAEKDDTYL